MVKQALSQTTLGLSFLICKVKIIVKWSEALVKIQGPSLYGGTAAGPGHCCCRRWRVLPRPAPAPGEQSTPEQVMSALQGKAASNDQSVWDVETGLSCQACPSYRCPRGRTEARVVTTRHFSSFCLVLLSSHHVGAQS